ncbi:MAG TPA: MarR family transcriptional regulator [Verrucomicrobiae bacterium]|nr:MarR family transcriptional regulator [Verrucomicrobiae bacterium]
MRANEQSARDLLDTAPVVMRFIRDQVRRRTTAGLSLPQFRTLSFLSRSNRPSLSTVAEYLGLSLPAMSRLVNGLVAGGLVGRQTVSNNRRQIALTVTARGRAVLEKVRGEVRRALANAMKNIPRANQETIQRAMHILRGVFDKPAVPDHPFEGAGL